MSEHSLLMLMASIGIFATVLGFILGMLRLFTFLHLREDRIDQCNDHHIRMKEIESDVRCLKNEINEICEICEISIQKGEKK